VWDPTLGVAHLPYRCLVLLFGPHRRLLLVCMYVELYGYIIFIGQSIMLRMRIEATHGRIQCLEDLLLTCSANNGANAQSLRTLLDSTKVLKSARRIQVGRPPRLKKIDMAGIAPLRVRLVGGYVYCCVLFGLPHFPMPRVACDKLSCLYSAEEPPRSLP